jgi:hypothetical protein
MSMSSAFDPSKGLAIPEDRATEDGLELDEDPASLGIEIAVVSGATADPTATRIVREHDDAGDGPAPRTGERPGRTPEGRR